jgi:hypothetical protein
MTKGERIMKVKALNLAISLLINSSILSTSAFAAGQGNPGGKPGGNPGGGGTVEAGANNLSFPLILSDNATPASLPLDGAWRFSDITSPDNCIDEDGVTPGESVDSDIVCYYGRKVNVIAETGAIEFEGDEKTWWLQKRTENFWKALSIGHNVSTPLIVSAIDIGDLLESSPAIQARQIRVEFNLLQNVQPDDPELGQYVVNDWSNPLPSPCSIPIEAGQSLGCFAALSMSGAIPGTERSGNEIQGVDFGPGSGNYPGMRILQDPTTLRTATTAEGTVIPIHALVYSNCARLLIQKIPETPVTWDQTTGQWQGAGVMAPLVNVATYNGTWSSEITSSGSIVYGYNWNAKTAPVGKYRITMVLDGNDDQGPMCTSTLATHFEQPTTQIVNQGEANLSASIIYAGDALLGDEGGLVYIDVPITTKGGGKNNKPN